MPLPAFGEAHSEAQETARFARMRPEERLKLFLELCDLTDSIQAGRPNRAALRAGVPLSDEAISLWRKLMRQAA